MATTAKTRAKRHTHVKRGWESNVPQFNIMDYSTSMMRTLSFFSGNVEGKEKQKLAINGWKAAKRNVDGFEKVSDGYFHQAGVLAYLIKAGVSLENKDIAHYDRFYHNIKELVDKKNEEQSASITPKIVSVRDNTNEVIRKHAAVFDGAIDDFIVSGNGFDAAAYIKANEIKPAISKAIAGLYKEQLKELQEAYAGSAPDLVEGYSNLGKRGLKKLIDFYQSMISATETAALISKTTRKPRARKEKPASVIAGKVKFLKEDITLKLKSVMPENVVGSTEVWAFNVKRRKLFRYVAVDGTQLSWKGTTVQNWDPEKSGGKTIRKPELFFKDIAGMSKRPLSKMFNDIKSVLAKANGRVNEETLIVKVF